MKTSTILIKQTLFRKESELFRKILLQPSRSTDLTFRLLYVDIEKQSLLNTCHIKSRINTKNYARIRAKMRLWKSLDLESPLRCKNDISDLIFCADEFKSGHRIV